MPDRTLPQPIYSDSKKSPTRGLVPCNLSKTAGNFSTKFYVPIMRSCHLYARLRIFIQSPATLTTLCHIKRDHPVRIMSLSCVQNVLHRPKHTLAFSDIFPKHLRIFSPNFTRLLSVHTYARVQIFIQLSLTVTKLCHIKCDHPACVSVDGGHFEHIMVVAINMA